MNKFYVILFLFTGCISLFSQQYSVEQYLNIRGAGSPQFSHDDSKIYFTQNVTGTSQIWMLDKPGGWPLQVTFFNDRISGYRVNPKRDLVLVEKDEGGSEYSQFYLMNGTGTSMEMITDNKPKVLYGFGRWSDDGSFFTYYSNERSPYFYDIYVYDVDKRSSERVYSSDHSNYPSVISPDGSYMVMTRSYRSDDNDLYLLDMNTKELKLITTHDNFNEPTEFYSVSFSKDGGKIYLISNFKSDFFRFFEYDISSGKLETSNIPVLRQYENWDVSNVTFSPDRSKAAFIINTDGYDKLLIYDFSAGREIEIPQALKSASITATRFSCGSEKIIIGVNSAANPSVLYEWTFSSGDVKQVTFPTLAGIPSSSFVEPELIRYKSFDGLEIPAFVYLPKNVEAGARLPCIIFIHGGPEGQSTYGFSALYQYFLNAGYAVIDPNVRGSTGYGKKYAALDNIRNRENSVKDIAYLVEYLKQRGDIDPDKIAVDGGSYGGYMVLACLTLYPELFAAGIDVVGISDFTTFLQNTADYRRSNRESEYGSLEKDFEFLKEISPINKVDRIKAPLMIIHGRNDPRVPVGEAEQMHQAIQGRGGTSELLIYEDEGHGLAKRKNWLDAYPKIVRFLDKYVKNKNSE
jgi:dipeptidyl aminopeptidase/acylaminoacyl peptidase